jgi:NADH dehydrogenase
MIATRERSSMLSTGRSNQHLGVEVGLELAPQDPASPWPIEAATPPLAAPIAPPPAAA